MAEAGATGGGLDIREVADGGGSDGAGVRVRVTDPEAPGTLSGPGVDVSAPALDFFPPC